MFGLGVQELVLILLILMVLFGAKRIPELMGGMGKGIKSFKKAMEGEEASPSETPPAQTGTPQAPPEKIEPK